MQQQTKSRKKPPYTTNRTAVALHMPETLVPEIEENSTPLNWKDVLQLQVHGEGSWLPLQSAETQPQEQRRIISIVAEDWIYLKNLSLSRMYSLNTIFQWITPDAFLASRIQEPSLWIFAYSENNTLKNSVQRWEYLEALQHKNRCWLL